MHHKAIALSAVADVDVAHVCAPAGAVAAAAAVADAVDAARGESAGATPFPLVHSAALLHVQCYTYMY